MSVAAASAAAAAVDAAAAAVSADLCDVTPQQVLQQLPLQPYNFMITTAAAAAAAVCAGLL
jgi:hypothetical protein